MRAVTSNAQPALRVADAIKRHCAGCLPGGGDTRELAARARRVVLAAIGPRAIEWHCTGGRRLSFGARPWCDVRAVASNAQPAFAWHANEAPLRWLSLGRWRNKRKLAARVLAVERWLRSPYAITEGHLHRRRGLSSLDARLWCDVRAVTSNTHSRLLRGRREQAPLRWLFPGRWRHTRACRAHAAVPRWLRLVLCTLRSGTSPAGGLSLSAQGRGATCELWPPTRTRHSRCKRTGATALAVSREVGNTRACRARAPCRAGCDRPTHYERTLHRREASLLQCKTVVRRASCDLQHTPGLRVAHERAPLRWLSLGRWRHTRACRARSVPRSAYCAHAP